MKNLARALKHGGDGANRRWPIHTFPPRAILSFTFNSSILRFNSFHVSKIDPLCYFIRKIVKAWEDLHEDTVGRKRNPLTSQRGHRFVGGAP